MGCKRTRRLGKKTWTKSSKAKRLRAMKKGKERAAAERLAAPSAPKLDHDNGSQLLPEDCLELLWFEDDNRNKLCFEDNGRIKLCVVDDGQNKKVLPTKCASFDESALVSSNKQEPVFAESPSTSRAEGNKVAKPTLSSTIKAMQPKVTVLPPQAAVTSPGSNPVGVKPICATYLRPIFQC